MDTSQFAGSDVTVVLQTTGQLTVSQMSEGGSTPTTDSDGDGPADGG